MKIKYVAKRKPLGCKSESLKHSFLPHSNIKILVTFLSNKFNEIK